MNEAKHTIVLHPLECLIAFALGRLVSKQHLCSDGHLFVKKLLRNCWHNVISKTIYSSAG